MTARVTDAEIIGVKHNMLTPIVEVEKIGDKRAFRCECECGEYTDVQLNHLRNGRTQSCGCLREQKKYPNVHRSIINCYRGMKKRCYDTKNKSYHRYGGRGIIVCREWLDDPSLFHTWAINNGWEKGLEIDRKDNDLNYSPYNCRFIKSKPNSQNQQRSRYWFVDGVRYESSRDAASVLKCSAATIRRRCNGKVLQSGNYSPPDPNCWSEPKYSEK